MIDTASARRAFRRRIGSAAAWLVLVAACGTDAVTLPEDFNAKKVKLVTVHFDQEAGVIRNLAGVQGQPSPTVVGDADLTDRFRLTGVNAIRVPQGYLCDYTLSGIFPDASASPNDPASYQFGAIDAVMQGAAGLRADGRDVNIVFQAVFDVGAESCQVGASGLQTGRPPTDVTLWKTVVVNALRHFNRNLIDNTRQPDATWFPTAQTFGVRWVEFGDDPMGRGGYTDVTRVVDDFVALAEAVRAAFPEDFQRIKVLGPSMRVDQVVGVGAHPVGQFVQALVDRGKGDLLDGLSIQLRSSLPAENGLIADAVRAMLDGAGLTGTELWVTRYEPNPDDIPDPVDMAQAWSAYAGAYATVSKMAFQSSVDMAVFYRGDRRHLTLDTGDIINVEHSPLWSRTGDWRPAGIAWQPWLLLASPDKPRVVVEPPAELDAGGLGVIAAKQTSPTCPDPADTGPCTKLLVVIANASIQLRQSTVTYTLEVDGLGSPEADPRQILVSRAIIREGTGVFSFESTDQLTLQGGRLTYQFDSTVPATEYLEFDLGGM